MAFTHFEEVLHPHHYTKVADDHWIAITDVISSTQAIQAGRYKDINTVGAACIIAVLNACQRAELPFVFGGDGACIVVPPRWLESTRNALIGCKKMARQAFDFELRCGLIPVAQLRQAGRQLRIAHYAATSKLALPVFSGGALTLADQWIKNPATAGLYEIKIPENTWIPDADFSGLECSWKPITPQRGMVANVIVQFLPECPPEASQDLIRLIGKTGHWEYNRPMFIKQQMCMGSSVNDTLSESKAFTQQNSSASKFKAIKKALMLQTLGRLVYQLEPGNWKHYFDDVRLQVDDKKFDDVLRTVLDCSTKDWHTLETALHAAKDRGWIRFGAHPSKAILMTCMVLDRNARHLHFIDGADGGYAMAAKNLKASAPH
jgi:hypothetical protein